MPLYEYECPQCLLKAELIRKSDDTYPVTCKCGEEMKKKLSAPHFKMDGKIQTQGTTTYTMKEHKIESNSPEGVQRSKEARQKHIKKGDVKQWAGENKERLKRGEDISME